MELTAEIIGVGTELLLGSTVNTDARDISEGLSALGINVYYHTVVGDNPSRLRLAVEIAKRRADIIITTGGLGPTCDDLTKQVLAECFGKKLVFHETEAERIRSYFKNSLHNTDITDNNMSQAMLPEGCTVFHNEWGTAPGCAFRGDGKHVIMLPGPPRECLSMFNNCAVPYLKELSDSEIVSHSIRIFGMGESAVEDRLRDKMLELKNPTLAPYAKEGEVMLRVTAKADSLEAAEEMMEPVMDMVRETLGDVIYAVDEDNLETVVLRILSEKKLTVSAAESCTGGLLQKRITDIPGASKAFTGGLVTYSDNTKTELLGISEELLEQEGAVSQAVARAMAEAVKTKLSTDFGLGITGVAGPDTDERGNEVGTVFVALAAFDGTYSREFHLGADRSRIRTMAVNHALDMLRRYLTGEKVV
ncbi:MAG: competence/damage-inducible protein A [Clostridiales bacterium]|jgi:nicotinamide-nucleotide amidase|nr:competence/damage-inducible protein A [Clostridiales bacterium]